MSIDVDIDVNLEIYFLTSEFLFLIVANPYVMIFVLVLLLF